MFCVNCGKPTSDSDKFCSYCGHQIPRGIENDRQTGIQKPSLSRTEKTGEKSPDSIEDAARAARRSRLQEIAKQHQAPKAANSDRTDSSSNPLSVRVQRTTSNYFIAHWRGELSLAVSFWVNVFLVNFILSLATLPFTNEQMSIDLQDSLGLRGLLASALTVEFLVLVVWIWQIVGTWRCATRRYAEGLRTGPGIVKLLIVFGTITTIARVAISTQDYLALLEHTFTPAYGSYEVTVNRDQVVLVGSLGSGAADSVEGVLGEHPMVSTLVIDSNGGYVYEGQKLANLVSRRGLSVHARNNCVSSCVLVLAAGKVRSAAAGTGIGLHRASTLTNEDLESDAIFDSIAQAGYPPEDFERGMSAPPEDMWYVGLEKAQEHGFLHYVGEVSAPEMQAQNGEDTPSHARQEIESALLSTRYYSELRKHFPDVFDRVATRMTTETRPGVSNATMFEKGMQIGNEEMGALLPKLLPNAGDRELVEFTNAMVEILSSMDRLACYEYSMLGTTQRVVQALGEIPRDTTIKLMDSFGGVIESSQVDFQRVKADDELTLAFLLEMPEPAIEKLSVLDVQPPLSNTQQIQTCEVMIALYSTAASLDMVEAGQILRALYSG